MQIDLLPLGLSFTGRQQLRFVVSGRNLLGTREQVPANAGQHVVHTGGDRAFYLQLPVQARSWQHPAPAAPRPS